ncbi:hypothetical protein OFC46_26120, partial [Escherichia coli]|nr:hypothetical protein [Escherichia coli]
VLSPLDQILDGVADGAVETPDGPGTIGMCASPILQLAVVGATGAAGHGQIFFESAQKGFDLL